MRGAARIFHSGFGEVATAVLLAMLAGCGSAAPSDKQDAAIADDASSAQDVAIDVANDALADGAPEASTQVVAALLARQMLLNLPVPRVADGDFLASNVWGVFNTNATANPRGDRLILLFRVETVSATEGRLTVGLGEEIGAPGEDLYRFRSDPAPLVLSATRTIWDGGFTEDKYLAELGSPIRIPFVPGGSDPPSELVLEPKPSGHGSLEVRFQDNGTGWSAWIDGLVVSQATLCTMWVDGVNLLDLVDGPPTAGILGDTTSSVNYQTCQSRLPADAGTTLDSTFGVDAFWLVNLAVDG